MNEQPITALSVIDAIDTNMVARTMDKIHSFQNIIQQAVKPGHDIGVIPGTNKPTLLKPGAEKIIMMMGLSSRFEIMDKVEDYEKGFFAYNIRCTLSRNGFDICEGVGNCNSRESKYVKSDPYSIANTILKMAKKRAYVDAALSVASLSDIFTQDLEDMADMQITPSGPSHRDNQGKSLLNQQITFGKYKGRTFSDLLENERQYLEWLAGSDNQKWSPIAQQVLDEEGKPSPDPADPGTDEGTESGDIPPAILKIANNAGMTAEDLLSFIDGKFGKPWANLSGNEKSEITKHLYELGQSAEDKTAGA